MLIFARLCCLRPNMNPPRKIPFLRRMKIYLRVGLGRYLFITNSLTCGTLMACGDGIQQRIERYFGVRPTVKHDWDRSRRMFVVGLAQGPPQHFFYGTLDHFIPSTQLRSIALKILLDQTIASPMCLLIFFIGMGLQEGHKLGEILTTFVRKFKTIYMVDWCVWPPAQFINFYFLPARFRVVYISTITMFYNCFLSFIHHGVD